MVLDLNSNTGQITITATNQLIINAPTTTINGLLNVTGRVTAGYGTADQVGVQTHTHNQAADSHGDAEAATNPPNPGT